MTRSISTSFSIEFWFKSTGGGGITANTQWWEGAGMVDAEMPGATNDFGVSLMTDGRIIAGTGNPDISIASSTGFNNGTWHHVVFTRNGSTGALVLYVNGTQRGSATGSTAALTAPTAIRFGSLLNGERFLAGQLDEIALYTNVLTAATSPTTTSPASPSPSLSGAAAWASAWAWPRSVCSRVLSRYICTATEASAVGVPSAGLVAHVLVGRASKRISVAEGGAGNRSFL